jgi:hypothetical protein
MSAVHTPAFAHLLPRAEIIEQLADDALLAMSKLRDALALQNANTPACRVDEAMEFTLAAARAAMGVR